ncbi:MAG TPA: hypothetical protein VHL98_02735 [Microvirga sp.]|jgi:hypothetical protein|nr:hypothetical protein [Microvirga sp.]
MSVPPRPLPVIPVTDLRGRGPVAHAVERREAMLSLRDACFSVVPRPLQGLVAPLDRVSAAWLKRTPSPFVGEVAQIAEIAGRPGVWFVNASYEWGCTTRVDDGAAPILRRTLDWPFPGLGRHVEVTLQDGGAGPYANVTWPGAVGVLTAVAAGRFAAAINQGPMYRRSDASLLLPLDFGLNAVGTWRRSDRWPVAHLLRHVFDTCRDFEEAVAVLSATPVAKPVLFSLAGAEAGQACLIERTETEARVHRGRCAIANDWHPDGPARPGRWLARGSLLRGHDDSSRRRNALQGHEAAEPFDWLREPVLNGLTRLAVEACPATGALGVIGFEPASKRMQSAAPATACLSMSVH